MALRGRLTAIGAVTALAGCVSATSMTPRENLTNARVLYDNGIGWQIIEGSRCKAGIAPADELIEDKNAPVFILFVENKTDSEFLFKTDQVIASAHGERLSVHGQKELKYIAMKSRNSAQVANALTSALYAVALSSSNRYPSVKQDLHAGLVASDRARVLERQTQSDFLYDVAESRTYIATNTLLPRQYYGGLFEVADFQRRGEVDSLEIALTACGEVKSFAFDATEADEPLGARGSVEEGRKAWPGRF